MLSEISKAWKCNTGIRVLILIVLEDALWVPCISASAISQTCLNPYCIGRCSLSQRILLCVTRFIEVLILIVLEDALWVNERWTNDERTNCLNPYCIGRCSLSSETSGVFQGADPVLILIVLEDALWENVIVVIAPTIEVLILIVLEDALWVLSFETTQFNTFCLNPYCIGRCSLSRLEFEFEGVMH